MQANDYNQSSMPPRMEMLTLPELKLLCKKHGIKGYSKLAKNDLIYTIHKHQLATTTITDKFFTNKTSSKPETKKSKSKTKQNILSKLIDSKQLVLLEHVSISGTSVIFHSSTRFVFDFNEVSKVYTAIGYLTDDMRVIPLSKSMIDTCKEWRFEYTLPENMSAKVDQTENEDGSTFNENDELDVLLKEALDLDNDDDDEYIPNYDELFVPYH